MICYLRSVGLAHRTTFAIAVVTLTGAAWACSTFDDADAPGSVEAGAPDAPSAEVGAVADANADAPAPPPFCKTDGGTFCEDFDDPGSGALPYTDVREGGTVTEVEDPHVSPPRALRTTFVRPDDGTCRYAVRGTPALQLAATGGFSVEYKIRPLAVPGRLLAGADITYEAADGKQCSFYFEARPTGAFLVVEPLEDPTPAQFIPLTRRLLAGEWSTVSWDVHGASGERRATVTVNGENAVLDATLEPPCQGGIRIVDIHIGLDCVTVDLGGDVDVAFDDLRVIAH